jgi:hypothetical protein
MDSVRQTQNRQPHPGKEIGQMAGITKDHRTKDTDAPQRWAVATDKCMSGWGQAPGASYVAYPIYDWSDEQELVRYMEARSDFIRVRVNLNLPRLRDGDHLAIYDRSLDRRR